MPLKPGDILLRGQYRILALLGCGARQPTTDLTGLPFTCQI